MSNNLTFKRLLASDCIRITKYDASGHISMLQSKHHVRVGLNLMMTHAKPGMATWPKPRSARVLSSIQALLLQAISQLPW